MAKYNTQFRLGKNKDVENMEYNQNCFNKMKSFVKEPILEKKDTNLPNASIKEKGKLHVCIYAKDGRNMALLSRTNKLILELLSGTKIIFYNFITPSKSIRIQMTLFKSMGADFVNFTDKELFINDLNQLTDCISEKGNTKGIEVYGNKIILHDSGDKNWKMASLLYLYGLQNNLGWELDVREKNNEKDFKKVMNQITAKNKLFKYDSKQINFSGPEDVILNNQVFDGVLHLTKQTDKIIHVKKEANLYKEHNEILSYAAQYYTDQGYSFTTEKFNIDLLLKKKDEYIISEIKSNSSRGSVFKAVGQLLFYRKIFTENFSVDKKNIKLMFWSKNKPKKELSEYLESLDIGIGIWNA